MGDGKDMQYIVFHMETPTKMAVFAHKKWVQEHFEKNFTFKAMAERALKRGRYVSAGRFLVPESLCLGDKPHDFHEAINDEELKALFSDEANKNLYIPNACAFVDVPSHTPSCGAAGDDAWRATREDWCGNPDAFDDETVSRCDFLREFHGEVCSCFRGRNGSDTIYNSKRYKSSPEMVALSMFTREHYPHVFAAASRQPESGKTSCDEPSSTPIHARAVGFTDSREKPPPKSIYPDDLLTAIMKDTAGAGREANGMTDEHSSFARFIKTLERLSMKNLFDEQGASGAAGGGAAGGGAAGGGAAGGGAAGGGAGRGRDEQMFDAEVGGE